MTSAQEQGGDRTSMEDITEEIQAAVDSGRDCKIPPGEFLISRTVLLDNDTVISGTGDCATTLRLAPGVNDNIFTNRDHEGGNSGIAISNLRLIGSSETQWKPESEKRLSFCNGLYLARSTDVLIQDLVVTNVKQTALHFRQSKKVAINGFVAEDLGWSGISTSGTSDLVATDFKIVDSGHDHRHSAIHLDGGSGAYLHGMIDKCVGNGVMLDASFAPFANAVVSVEASRCMRGIAMIGSQESQPHSITVARSLVTNNEVGVMVSNARWAHIVESEIIDNRDYGVLFQGRVGGRESFVTHCRFRGNGRDIEEIHESDDNYWYGNEAIV